MPFFSPPPHRPSNAKIGDAILLTKPLGTHLATTLHRWTTDAEKLASVNAVITKSEIEISYNMALNSMIHLNRTGNLNLGYFSLKKSVLKRNNFHAIVCLFQLLT